MKGISDMLEFCSHTTQWSSFRASYQDLGSPTDALKTAKLKPTKNRTVHLFHQRILVNYSRRFGLSVSHVLACSNARNCLHL